MLKLKSLINSDIKPYNNHFHVISRTFLILSIFSGNFQSITLIKDVTASHGHDNNQQKETSFIVPPPETIRTSKLPNRELLLTLDEKIVFDKFKAAVLSSKAEDYLKHDLYLLRWLKAKNFNLELAIKDYKQMLIFLRENGLDRINFKDFSDIASDFPFDYNSVVDRQGRPVGLISIGEGWNVRRAILQGKQIRLMQYVFQRFVKLLGMVLEINKRQSNITQFLLVVNIQEFSLYQHVCPQCLMSYIKLLGGYEQYFPGFAREIIIINAGEAYKILLTTLRPLLSSHTRKALKVFSVDRTKWKHYLNERIDIANQLSWEFGGNKVPENSQ